MHNLSYVKPHEEEQRGERNLRKCAVKIIFVNLIYNQASFNNS